MSRRFIFAAAIVGSVVLAGSVSVLAGRSASGAKESTPIPVLPPPVERCPLARLQCVLEAAVRNGDGLVRAQHLRHVFRVARVRGVVEHKYYVKGVGNVRTVMVKGGSEEEYVLSITR